MHMSQAAGNLVFGGKGEKEALIFFPETGQPWRGPGCPIQTQDQEAGEGMLVPEGQPRAFQILAV